MSNLTVAVRYDEVAELPPRETKLLIFRKVAEPLYHDGPEGILRLAPNVEAKQAERLERDAGLVTPLTEDSHQRLRVPLEILGAVSLVLIVLLARFSSGLGRLVSPGVVLVLGGLPGLLLLAILSGVGDQAGALPAGETVGIDYAARQAVPITLPALTWGYLASLGLGAALLFAAAVGRVARRWRSSFS